MRIGCYEVIVTSENDVACEQVVVGDDHYVIANPGKEFCVRVIVHRNEQGEFPFPHFRVGLFVDGIDVNYWKRIDATYAHDEFSCTSFWGFKKNVEELRAFTFAETVISDRPAVPVAGGQQSALGTIRVVIYKARPAAGTFMNDAGYHEMPDTTMRISESKKFWTQPSVTTRAGRKVTKEKFQPLQRWEHAEDHPAQTLLLYYHTRELVTFLRTFHANKQNVHPEINDGRVRPRGQAENPHAKRARVVVDLTDDDANVKVERGGMEMGGALGGEEVLIVESQLPPAPVVHLDEDEPDPRELRQPKVEPSLSSTSSNLY